MKGRKKAATAFSDDAEPQLEPQTPHRELLSGKGSESSSRVKTYSDGPSLGIFRRGKQYDELLDDAASASPRGSDPSARNGSGYFSDGEGEAQKPKRPQGQRTGSGSLNDGLFSKLSLKERRASRQQMSQSVLGTDGSPEEGMEAGSATKTPSSRNGKSPAAAASAGVGRDSLEFGSGANEPRRSSEPRSSEQRRRSSERRSSEHRPVPEHETPFARSSPSLLTTAAKLAASFQGNRRTMTRKKSGEVFSLMDDSAAEAEPGASEADHEPATRSGQPVPVMSQRDQNRSLRFADSASPGAMRPLLDSADAYDENNTEVEVGRALPPANPNFGRSASQVHPRRPLGLPTNPSGGGGGGGGGPMTQAAARWSHERARSESALTHRRSEAASRASGERSSSVAYDIFEPRPAPDGTAVSPQQLSSHRTSKSMASSPSITDIESMKGHEALETLRLGSQLKKKWVTTTAVSAASQAPKTERLIRCRIEGCKVVLHYHHQGVKGLLDKEEVVTHVQRVEVAEGPWTRGDCILAHTGRGILALEAPDAATHATWMLGLNAALVSAQTRGREMLLEAPVRAIPRNSMFVVSSPQN